MKRITLISILTLCLLTGFLPPATGQDVVSDDVEEISPNRTVQRTSPNPGIRANEECPHEDMRCEVNERIDFLEGTVQGLNKGYKDGSTWTTLKYENNTDTKYGYKALHQIAMSPSYALKAITWPFALGANELIEHGIVRDVIDVVSNDERTFWVYPKLELGFGSGFGGGIGVRHYDLFHRKFLLEVSYEIHIDLNQTQYTSFGKDDIAHIADHPVAFRVISHFKHRNRDNYYGIGIGQPESAKSQFGYDEYRAGGWVGYEFIEHLMLKLHSYFVWNDSRSGSGTPLAINTFPASQLAGYGQDIYYANFGLELVHDTRDCVAAPEHGGKRSIRFWRYQGVNTTNFDYNEYRLDVSQFFRVWRPRNVFVLRTMWKYQQQTGAAIPFYRLATLDVYSPLRGFGWGRFRDRGMAVFNVEYRFPVWDYLDGQFFFDTGRVFHKPTDFSFKNFKYSGGVGVRLRTRDYFLMRLQFAYGGEGAHFLLKTSQAF